MNKKQKDNLIKALEELNAPDKEVLLQKIESKKALGGEWTAQQEAQKARRKKRVAWTSFACSAVVVVLSLILISISIFGVGGGNPNGGDVVGDGFYDFRTSWNFKYYSNISFDGIDMTVKQADVDLIYQYDSSWNIVKTQVTQDESAYREFYEKDGVVIEVTIFLEEKVSSLESEYYEILCNVKDSFYNDKYRVYTSSYMTGSLLKKAYVIYLRDQVYVIISDSDIEYIFRSDSLETA